MASDTELRKRGRGSAEEYEAVVDNQKVIVVKWYDNRSVTTASTFAGAQPVSTVMRWDRREKKTVQDCQSLGVPKNKQRDLLKFRLGIAEALCKQGKDLSSKKRGRPSGSL
ncbi:hypothetical protein HPB47_006900 [Ixodes persulcatus]|uniref:Uncharacterized protein n=1 Tax=Ixodes persulcatus TaxID=34615 RepID=A0AC60P8V6_IXOPE|nr:hypothetical protein HPB47_006900 [Ixodes persulcatus]